MRSIITIIYMCAVSRLFLAGWNPLMHDLLHPITKKILDEQRLCPQLLTEVDEGLLESSLLNKRVYGHYSDYSNFFTLRLRNALFDLFYFMVTPQGGGISFYLLYNREPMDKAVVVFFASIFILCAQVNDIPALCRDTVSEVLDETRALGF